MNEIIYRQLTAADHKEYKRVRLECLKLYPIHFGSTYEEGKSELVKPGDTIPFTDRSNFIIGAFTGKEKLIGICGFVTEKRFKTKHRGELRQLYVDPEHLGKGIGRKLTELVIEKAFSNDHTEQITLCVVQSNTIAVNLYKDLGFVEYGKLENYFKVDGRYFTQVFMALPKKKKRLYGTLDFFNFSMNKGGHKTGNASHV